MSDNRDPTPGISPEKRITEAARAGLGNSFRFDVSPQVAPRDLAGSEAFHRRGIALVEQGDSEGAVRAFEQALQLDPENAAAGLDLARTLTRMNRLEEALEHYRRALALSPRNAAAMSDLGVTLTLLGRFAEAIAALRQAVGIDPASADAHSSLGVALAESGQLQEAENEYTRALELTPAHLNAQTNLAHCYAQQGRMKEAAEHFRRTLALNPQSEPALNNLGAALSELKRFAEASVFLRQAIRLDPKSVEAHNNLAAALAEMGRWYKAEIAYERALELNPANVEALSNLADLQAHAGRLPEAIAGFDLALCYQPNHLTAHMNRAMALLSGGNYPEGFAEFEWRWRRARTPMRPYPEPMWDGEDLTGKSILLWHEEGLGDSIQFIRFAAKVKARGAAQVIVECPSPLVGLFVTCPGIDRAIAGNAPPDQRPHFHVHAPLMSLPRILGVTLATVPADVPYLTADPNRVDRWREKLANEKGLKIGIAWQGNPQHKNDHHRSMPLNRFLPLAEMSDVRLFSLQRGFGSEQIGAQENDLLRSLPTSVDPALTPAEAMSELAAVIVKLDLVITVDTAVAHLAGALGKPVWVLLSRQTDWRWLRGRRRSPWYPSMRLFRQRHLDRWRPVMAQVCMKIERLSHNSGQTV